MDAEIRQIVETLTRFCIDRGFPESCRSGNDPEVATALQRLGVDPESALAFLFQHLIGPFSSEGEHVLPQLLDVVSGGRNIVSFSKEFWENNNSAPRSILAISEIDTMTGLFYEVTNDAVFEVDFEQNFPKFLNGQLPPRWTNSDDFLLEFFGEERKKDSDGLQPASS